MELKHMKPLFAASVINLCLGLFLIGSGLLEFTGILHTDANTTIRTVGIRLSYLVFVSGVLVFLSGFHTVISRKSMLHIDLQIFVGVMSLAWPIFVSIALFFAEYVICIRLLPTMLSSLFYMITILIVKITNEALKKSHAFNPSAQIASMGKRKQRVDVSRVFNSQNKKHSTVRFERLSGLLGKSRSKNHSKLGTKLFYSGSRRKGNGKFGGFLYSGSRRRGKIRLKK